MKQGTASVLFGCHSSIHALIVLITWRRWHKCWPAWWQVVCILLHDIGHWGKNYLDDYEAKKKHSLLGAVVAWQLFGDKGYDLVAGHNQYEGHERSELYHPDKYSWVIAPVWWLMSNQIFEPKLIRKNSGRKESAVMFKDAMRKNMQTDFQEQGHDIYLRQWGHSG